MRKIRKDLLKSYLLKLALVAVFIVLDLITKHFFYGINATIIPYIIGFRDAGGLNTGGAWGIFKNLTWLLILFTIVFLVIIVLLEIFKPSTHPLYLVAISLVVGGTIGNLIDRIILKGVRDFIFFEFMPSFPTFNLADSFLCIGIFLLLIYIILMYSKDEKTKIPKNKV